tara:strand:- start:327 stop:512 length:186 start_codon:yes stop_codon:yes gene_type:complete
MKLTKDQKQDIRDIVYEIADEANSSLSITKHEKKLQKYLFKFIEYTANTNLINTKLLTPQK